MRQDPPSIVIQKLDGELWGWCDYDEKTLFVEQKLKAHDFMDTIIHEHLHWYFPDLNEKTVERIATQIADSLWKLRFRRIAK